MATQQTTPMAVCGPRGPYAEALAHFEERIEESFKTTKPDLLAGLIGARLRDVSDRLQKLHDALEWARDRSYSVADEDNQLAALLAMMADYAKETCSLSFELGGNVLDAMQRSGFVRVEVPNHG